MKNEVIAVFDSSLLIHKKKKFKLKDTTSVERIKIDYSDTQT